MQCPVCKAENTQGPACRRCRADLSHLWTLEARRVAVLSAARRFLEKGEWQRAAAEAEAAARLRAGPDSGRLVVLARLLGRDFAGAWRAYRVLNPAG